MNTTRQGANMNITESLLYRLAILAVTKDADSETKATHRALRAQYGMNPDIHQPGA